MTNKDDPNQTPKPVEGLSPNLIVGTELGDPEAPALIRRIMESPAYVRADTIPAFCTGTSSGTPACRSSI